MDWGQGNKESSIDLIEIIIMDGAVAKLYYTAKPKTLVIGFHRWVDGCVWVNCLREVEPKNDLLSVGASVIICISVEISIVIGLINLKFLTRLHLCSCFCKFIIHYAVLALPYESSCYLCTNDWKFIDSFLCRCRSQLLLELGGNWDMFEWKWIL